MISYEHAIPIPGTDRKARFTCPHMMDKAQCPACDERAELSRTGNRLDKERAWKMRPDRRVYANIVDRDDMAAGVQVCVFGKGIHESLLAIRKDKHEGGDFVDPSAKGFDIVVTRKGKGQFDTKYEVRRSVKNSPLHEDPVRMSELIGAQYDLSQYASVPTVKEILEMLAGEAPRRGGGGRGRDEEEPSTSSRGRGKSAQEEAEEDDGKW